MRNIDIYIDKNNKLKVVVHKYDKLEKVELKLRGNNAKNYLKKFYNTRVISNNDDGYNLQVHGDSFSLNIIDYHKFSRNRELLNTIYPIIDNVKKQEEQIKASELKTARVKRVNKYALGAISFIGAAAIAATSIISASGFGKKSNDISVKKVEAYTEDGLDHYVFEVVDDNIDDKVNFDVEENTYQNVEEEPVFEGVTLQEVGKIEEEPTYDYNEEPLEYNFDAEETVYIDHLDDSKSEKALNAYLNYNDVISKYSEMYGLDAKLMMGLATQESGVHTTDLFGPAIGLMRVENYWIGKEVTAYNFEEQGYKTIIITAEKLQNLELNVEIACMLFQNGLVAVNYNPILGLQMYNMGGPNMDIILDSYSAVSGRSREDIINTKTDLGWMDYTYIPGEGDPEYVRNVLSFVGDEHTITNTKPNGEQVSIHVKNYENTKIY